MNALYNLIKKWWPSIIVGAGALWTAFGPQIVNYVQNHPKWTAIIGAVTIVLSHLTPSPLSADPASPAPSSMNMRSGSKVVAVFLLVGISFGIAGCSAYNDTLQALNVVGQVITLAQADIPSLEASGVITTPSGTAAGNWLAGASALQQQAVTCVTNAGSKGAKSTFATCVTALGLGLISPAEMADLRIVDAKSQHQITIYVTAVILAANAVSVIVNATATSVPPVGSTTTAPSTAPTAAELQGIARRAGISERQMVAFGY
jgi:hypothetical protein